MNNSKEKVIVKKKDFDDLLKQILTSGVSENTHRKIKRPTQEELKKKYKIIKNELGVFEMVEVK